MALESQDFSYDSEDGNYVWQKGVVAQLSKDFTTAEFTCPCHNSQCTRQIISAKLIGDLQCVRNNVGMPIGVNSGYRCTYYQNELKLRGYETATGISQHQLGKAADIRCSDLLLLVTEAEKNFKAIGIGHTFIHVDERDDKIRRWRYGTM